MFGVQRQNTARRAGFSVVNLRPGQPVPAGDVMIVDMSTRGDWPGAVREAARAGIRVVAFGPHSDLEARQRAREAGADRLLANSNLARELPIELDDIRRSRLPHEGRDDAEQLD